VFSGSLLEALEGANEAADVVWMLLVLKTFSLKNVNVLVKECLKRLSTSIEWIF